MISDAKEKVWPGKPFPFHIRGNPNRPVRGRNELSKLTKRASITEQHLSRILPRLEDHQLIYSKYPKMQRINRLIPKGRLVALLALQEKRALEKMKFSEEQVQELKVWAGEDIKRRR